MKIFLKLVSAIWLISQVSCSSGDATHMDRAARTHPDTASVVLTNSTKASKTAFDTAGAEIYEYKTASLQQELMIQRLSKLSISFRLTTRLPRTGEMEMVQGKAIAAESSNAEEDEDEEGMSYGARAYSFPSGNCSLSFHLSTDPPKEMAHVYEFNCKEAHKASLPYETGKVLRRRH